VLGQTKKTSKTIWSIGGGKGGTGKTFVSASLGLLVSGNGTQVTMIDADLGAPNLHTFLGVPKTDVTLADFVDRHVPKLTDVVRKTPYRGLSLVAGSHERLFMANLTHLQKQKLLRHIRALESGRTIVDIGGGTHFNCIDFFPISDLPVMVVNPDPASTENAYQFLRSVSLRILKSSIRHFEIEKMIKEAAKSRGGAPTIPGFLDMLCSYNREYGELLGGELDRFRPCLIVNKSMTADDAVLGTSMVHLVRKYLGVNINFLGAVPNDDKVAFSLKHMTPYVFAHPNSKTTLALRVIADRMLMYESTAAGRKSAS
jgi:flagellar biosynthesis protein FlhG